MLAPNPLATTWPIAGDVPDLTAIVNDQAATIEDNEALLHAYQEVLNGAPAGPVATASGTTSGLSTSVTLTNALGVIVTGSSVTGTGVPTTATTVLGQINGAVGGDGVYLLSQPLDLISATVLTFTPPPAAGSWPNNPQALMSIQTAQASILRNQSSLLQHYQDLLNIAQIPPPATGP